MKMIWKLHLQQKSDRIKKRWSYFCRDGFSFLFACRLVAALICLYRDLFYRVIKINIISLIHGQHRWRNRMKHFMLISTIRDLNHLERFCNSVCVCSVCLSFILYLNCTVNDPNSCQRPKYIRKQAEMNQLVYGSLTNLARFLIFFDRNLHFHFISFFFLNISWSKMDSQSDDDSDSVCILEENNCSTMLNVLQFNAEENYC